MNYLEKFTEEPDFAELHTQAKHLRVWILHGKWLDDSPRYYCFYTFSLLKYDTIFSKKLEHDTYGVK